MEIVNMLVGLTYKYVQQLRTYILVTMALCRLNEGVHWLSQ